MRLAFTGLTKGEFQFEIEGAEKMVRRISFNHYQSVLQPKFRAQAATSDEPAKKGKGGGGGGRGGRKK